MLIVFAGLPGTGKSSVARELAGKLDAVWLRIDSIEQAIRDSAVLPGSIDDAGYRAAFAVAGDNLRLGRVIVADSVNDWMVTRDAWRDLGGELAPVWSRLRWSARTHRSIVGALRPAQPTFPGSLRPIGRL
jgi:predicted kinase